MIKLRAILSEETNNFIEFGYHYTSKENYERIKIEGLKINQEHFLTSTFGTGQNDSWITRAYKMNPIFMGLEPMTKFGPRMPMGSEYDWVLLKVNVMGLNIAADLGMLIDHGAYTEENGFWFKNKPVWLEDNEYSYDDLLGSDKLNIREVINRTRTFAVLQNIPPDKIEMVKYKGQTIDKIKKLPGMSLPFKYLDFYKDMFKTGSDAEHSKALSKTGFWGKKGAGCIFLAKKTKRILLPKRSSSVLEGNTWGTWGGAIDAKENPEDAVKREAKEEAGYTGPMELVPLAVFQKDSFQYHNFLAIVEDEFTPRLQWETEDYKWVEYGNWPSPLHSGLKYLLDNSGDKIQKIINNI